MEPNKLPKHTCTKELEIKRLKKQHAISETLKIILTPRMFLAVCFGLSVLIQTMKGL